MELYRVEVYYLRRKQIATLIEKHFKCIYEFKNPDENELERDERNAVKSEFDTAITFFRTILCNLEEFESWEDAEGFFEDADSVDDANKLEWLEGKITKYLTTLDCHEGRSFFTAESNAELDEGLARYSRPSSSTDGDEKQPSPWPLISKIRLVT